MINNNLHFFASDIDYWTEELGREMHACQLLRTSLSFSALCYDWALDYYEMHPDNEYDDADSTFEDGSKYGRLEWDDNIEAMVDTI
jgi:hypothetical protein